MTTSLYTILRILCFAERRGTKSEGPTRNGGVDESNMLYFSSYIQWPTVATDRTGNVGDNKRCQ